jgi:hypothetical protein
VVPCQGVVKADRVPEEFRTDAIPFVPKLEEWAVFDDLLDEVCPAWPTKFVHLAQLKQVWLHDEMVTRLAKTWQTWEEGTGFWTHLLLLGKPRRFQKPFLVNTRRREAVHDVFISPFLVPHPYGKGVPQMGAVREVWQMPRDSPYVRRADRDGMERAVRGFADRLPDSARAGACKVAFVLLVCQADGTKMPEFKQLAKLARVDKDNVTKYKRTLARVVPSIFPILVGARAAELARDFQDSPEWLAVVAELQDGENPRKDLDLAVALEVRAGECNRRDPPSWTTIATNLHADEGAVAKSLLKWAWPDAFRKLRLAALAVRPAWTEEELGLFKPEMVERSAAVGAWLCVARLRDEELRGEEVSVATGLAVRTAQQYLQEAEPLVDKFIDDLKKRRAAAARAGQKRAASG